MREFFQGWRRKAGLAILALAVPARGQFQNLIRGLDNRFPDSYRFQTTVRSLLLTLISIALERSSHATDHD